MLAGRVEAEFGVVDTASGLTALLRHLGLVCNEPKLMPWKAKSRGVGGATREVRRTEQRQR